MVVLQRNTTIENFPWDLGGRAKVKDDQTFLQDGTRATDLLFLTLLSRVSAGGKLVPLTDVTAADGTAFPIGFFGGTDIPFVDLVAGDVTNQKVMVLGEPKKISEDHIVLEGGVTLDDVITAGVVGTSTIREELYKLGFVIQPVENNEVINPLV